MVLTWAKRARRVLLARNLDKRSTNFLYYLRAWKKWEKVSDIKLRGAVSRGGNLDL